MQPSPSLRFPVSELAYWQGKYEYPVDETRLENSRPNIQSRGYLSKSDLRAVCLWKSPRSARRMETNTEEYVAEVTAFALGARTDRASIQALTLLDGVGWPTASVILHFYAERRFPILDFRALWSVGLEVLPQYNFDFWQVYACFCRDVAERVGISMRSLDRALWQYSKSNQSAEQLRHA